MAVLAHGSFRALPLQTAGDQPIRWDLQELAQEPLGIRFYQTYPSSQPDAERLRMAIANGMRTWNWALSNRVPFELWTGQEESRFPPRFLNDQMNSVFWRSSGMRQGDPVANAMGSAQAAYTEVYFDPATGAVQGFDMALNDVDFRFVSRADVASGAAPAPTLENKFIYLEDTVLHELGHVLGLDHSLDPDAVLFPNPRRIPGALGCDDLSSIQSVYPQPQAQPAELSGTLVSESGLPLAGVGVMAVHRNNPSVRASTATSAQGVFSLKGVRAGEYALFVYPLKPFARYFADSGDWSELRLCPDPRKKSDAVALPAQWISAEDGHVTWVGTSTAASAQRYALRCSLARGEAPAVASTRFPVQLHPGGPAQAPVWSISDRLRNRPEHVPQEMRHYRWTHEGGPASINWLSDAIGSEHSVELSLWKVTGKDQAPSPVAAQAPVPQSPGMHQIWFPALDAGDYLVGVKRSDYRAPRQNLFGQAMRPWSYFVWVSQAPLLPGCPPAPQTWPSYQPSTPEPPELGQGSGCRVASSLTQRVPWCLVLTMPGLFLLRRRTARI